MGVPILSMERGLSSSNQNPGSRRLTSSPVSSAEKSTPKHSSLTSSRRPATQVTNELAGAPDASRFLMAEVEAKSGEWWRLADIPSGLGKPLVGSVLRKADKYSTAREGSPLLGVVAYFNERGPGKQILTMLAYFKAIYEELGQVSDKLAGELLVNRTHALTMQFLKWDQPLAFPPSARRGRCQYSRRARGERARASRSVSRS